MTRSTGTARPLRAKEHHTIREWGVITGIHVMDPDGFDRTDPQLMEKKFTREEFDAGVITSTCRWPSRAKEGRIDLTMTETPITNTCGIPDCERHMPRKEIQVRDTKYDRRPLLCRLGHHPHYTRNYFGKPTQTHYRCVVCDHTWLRCGRA